MLQCDVGLVISTGHQFDSLPRAGQIVAVTEQYNLVLSKGW